jgi:hypothetical protein
VTYTVAIDRDAADAALHRTVLAGLPNSYRLVDKDAEVVLVSAPDPAQLERLCSHHTRALVIDRPGLLRPAYLDAIADVASRNSCIVVPAPRYAPRLAETSDLLGDAGIDIVESTIISGGDFRASLVEQLALVRVVLGSVASIRVLRVSTSHYAFQATLADHPQSSVLLNGVATPSGSDEASLHVLGAQRRLVVRIDAGPVARPAAICSYDEGGARTPWPLHQHAHRITLSRLHVLLATGDGALKYSLDDLRHDVQLADVPW